MTTQKARNRAWFTRLPRFKTDKSWCSLTKGFWYVQWHGAVPDTLYSSAPHPKGSPPPTEQERWRSDPLLALMKKIQFSIYCALSCSYLEKLKTEKLSWQCMETIRGLDFWAWAQKPFSFEPVYFFPIPLNWIRNYRRKEKIKWRKRM